MAEEGGRADNRLDEEALAELIDDDDSDRFTVAGDDNFDEALDEVDVPDDVVPVDESSFVTFFDAWPSSVFLHFDANANEQSVSPRLYIAGLMLTTIKTCSNHAYEP